MDKMKLCIVKLSKIDINSGQIDGLPQNPRFIRDKRFDKLVQSLRELPDMVQARPVLVYPFGGRFVAIGGNMRVRAARQLKWENIHCAVLPESTPIERLMEYAIKDNLEFGEDDWEILANEWDVDKLLDWGMKVPSFSDEEEDAEREATASIKFIYPKGVLKAVTDALLATGEESIEQGLLKLLKLK